MKKRLLLCLLVGLSSCGAAKKTQDTAGSPASAVGFVPALVPVVASGLEGYLSQQVDSVPRFRGVGNESAFRLWVMKQVVYPMDMMRRNVSGKVTAAFVIDERGIISAAEILQSTHLEFSAEIIRVLSISPP